MEAIKFISPQNGSLLTLMFSALGLYFSVSFGESLGKTIFYLSH